jgi:hypothetical protein
MLILSTFSDQKSSQYFLRKMYFKLAFFLIWAWGVWGEAALFRFFEFPANGGGGRGGADLLARRSPHPAWGILDLPPFFYSLPCLPGRIRPTPAVKTSLNCRL